MILKNKTIIVTGGGNGMGREMVLNLLERGNNVIALDINETALQKTVELSGTKKNALATFVIDITQKEHIDGLADKIVSVFGRVDGIINNAGIMQPFEQLNDMSFETVKKVFDINFYGTLYLIKAFLPHLLTRPEAHIVNVSSMGGFMPFPEQSIYGASKAAVKIMSESLAAELEETNVCVTTVFPGAIFTDIKINSGLSGVSASNCDKAPKGMTLPSVAVKTIFDGVEHNKSRIFVGKDAKMMNLLYRLNPNFACKMINGQIKKMRNKIKNYN
ncbi:MAG: SDR family oxidoreductase [Tannerella sp.]|jgi:short-subunit dehydrogenase|nr:SDR family oxidoreductase [Tannerella sp.]